MCIYSLLFVAIYTFHLFTLGTNEERANPNPNPRCSLDSELPGFCEFCTCVDIFAEIYLFHCTLC